MKGFLRIGAIFWCMLVVWLAPGRVGAQTFTMLVTPSSNSIPLNGTLVFNIAITNIGASLSDLVLTNLASGAEQSIQILSAYPAGTPSTNGSGLTYDFGPVVSGEIPTLSFSVQGVNGGVLTNFFQLSSIDLTNTLTTNIVTTVTSGQSDLGVGIEFPLQTVITNDYAYFTLSVTNFGPGTVTDVALTNTLPTGLYWFGLYPTNQTYATNSTSQIFYLGTLASGAFTNITYEVAATNLGSFGVTASVGAPGLVDPNLTNNYATNTLVATNYAFRMFVNTNSPAKVNYQNGLVEQSVNVVNAANSPVSAVRVLIDGLTNELVNATGTNLVNIGGTNYYRPFVVYNGTVGVGQSVQLLLQFAPRGNGSFSLAYGQVQAFAMFASEMTAPALTGTSTNLNFDRMVKMANGDVLLEFPATLGKSYTVVYSDNIWFTNAVIVQPPITAHANEVQWIDYGPPATATVPINTPARYYRLYQNP